ncbi:MAG TPA: exosortase/archaeosortase family protein [Verrucomicrobiae bacterium]|nr:exosortase/archaeosortase family protein [Verrucomicrobiae bacterium]
MHSEPLRANISDSSELQTKARPTSAPGWVSRLGAGWAWGLLALGVSWFMVFQELSDEWRLNPQYGYGYMVPFLTIALFLRRWPGRPATSSDRVHWAAPIAAGLVLLIPVIRVCLQANPEWRLLYWLHAAVAVGLSLCAVGFAGGIRWVRFFAPPILFALVAVPWPMLLEQWIIQGLMRVTAWLTVESVGWLGIPAVQHGNVIETTVGLVGIDEACSGVRSLQSALMLSLFLGEMYRFAPGRRLALIGASLLFDLAANLARTSFLVWAAANRGVTQMEAWHDQAGLLVMLIVLPGLLLLGRLLKRGARLATPPQSTHGSLPALPGWLGAGALIWLALGDAGSELWYRSHETHLIPTARWSAAWPTESSHFKKAVVPEKALAILRCSDSQAAAWQDSAGNEWSGFLLKWKPGKNSAQLASGHKPDICFTAAGAKLLEDFGKVVVRVQDFQMAFRHQSFEMNGRIFHVFYCLWPDRISPTEKPLLEDGSQLSRIEAVLAGKRHLGQQVLELVVGGPDSGEQATDTFRATLPGLVQPARLN